MWRAPKRSPVAGRIRAEISKRGSLTRHRQALAGAAIFFRLAFDAYVIGLGSCVALLLSQPTRPASKPRSVFATAVVQLRDAVQNTAMSSSQAPITQNLNITPPSSFANHPLTPPPTDEKQFAQVHRVIALFEEIRAGRHIKRHPWTEFQLAEGDYDEIERQLEQDEVLSGYVKDKIRCVCRKIGRRLLTTEMWQV